MRRTLTLALAATLVGAAAATAQSNACADKGPKLPAAGGWAEYHADSGDFKMMYIGHETAGERIEMAMNRTMRNGEATNVVMQLVVPAFPYQMAQASEMVMQMGDRPPMKVSGQMLDMMRQRAPDQSALSPDLCARLTKVGTESVTVPAGTFSTTHYRDAQTNTDVWVDPSVPFGAVKVVSPHTTMVLKAKGTGGTTGIRGTPQEMGPGMMGPPGGRRPGGH